MSKDSRASDRLIGFFVTVSLGLMIYFSAGSIKQLIEKNSNLFNNKKDDDDSNEHDEIYKCRYNNNNNNDNINHLGSCHCKRVKFQCKASSKLRCVDIPTKLRFPRLTIPCANFELLTDENLLSLYPIQSHSDNMGVYTFCSFCGMHILFAESLDPIDIQINVECLDKNNIEDITVTYHSQSESLPCAVTYEPASYHVFEKRGIGALYHPSFDNFMPFTSDRPSSLIDKHNEQKNDRDLLVNKTNSNDDTVSSNNGSPKYNNEENLFYTNNDSKSDSNSSNNSNSNNSNNSNKHNNKSRISRPLENIELNIELNTPMHDRLQTLSKYLSNSNNDDSNTTTTI